jgi:hypothetical protein
VIVSSRRAFTALAVGLAIVATSSCGSYEARDEAEGFVERYFTATGGDDVVAALAFYSPKFFAGTPRDQWLSTLQGVRDRCGTPTSHSLKGWTATNLIGTESGSTVTLTYDVRYASCRLSETLVVFRPEGGEDKILRHLIKLEGPMPDKTNPAGTSS